MKRIGLLLIGLTAFLSVKGQSQFPSANNRPVTNAQEKITKLFWLSTTDTTDYSAVTYPGALAFRQADSTFYYSTGAKWAPIGGKVDLSGYVLKDSVYFRRVVDSLFELKQDTGTAILNQNNFKQNAVSRYKKTTIDTITNQLLPQSAFDFRNAANIFRWDGTRLILANAASGINIGNLAGNGNPNNQGIFIGNGSGLSSSGSTDMALGTYSFQGSYGNYDNSYGYKSLSVFKGNNSSSFGHSAGIWSNGNNLSFFGAEAGYMANADSSTFIGYRSGMNSVVSDTIYSPNFNSVVSNSVASLAFSGPSVDSLVSKYGLAVDSIYPVDIIFFDPAPIMISDSIHRLTRKLYIASSDSIIVLFSSGINSSYAINFAINIGDKKLSNVQVFGNYATADTSNQVALGNNNIKQIKWGGLGKLKWATNISPQKGQVPIWDSATSQFIPGPVSAAAKAGITRLGISANLIKPNDSTYLADTTILSTVTHTTATISDSLKDVIKRETKTQFDSAFSQLYKNDYFKSYVNSTLPANGIYLYKENNSTKTIHVGLNYPSGYSAEYTLFLQDSVYLNGGAYFGQTILPIFTDTTPTLLTSSTVLKYTTTIGDSLTFDFEGRGFYFRTRYDNKGGIWRFIVDNTDSTDISIYNATVVADSIVKIPLSLDYGPHHVSCKFMGADPSNPPSGGDYRGWVHYGLTNATYPIYVLSNNGVLSPLFYRKQIISNTIPEFAISGSPVGTSFGSHYVPAHSGDTKVSRNVTSKIVTPDFSLSSYDPIVDTIYNIKSLIIRQSATGYNAEDISGNYPEFKYDLMHSFSLSNQLTVSKKLSFLNNYNGYGYLSMVGVQNGVFNKLLYGDSVKQLSLSVPGTIIDDTLNQYRNTGAFVDSTSGLFYTFKTNLKDAIETNIDNFSNRGQPFYQTRPTGINKIYFPNHALGYINTIDSGNVISQTTQYYFNKPQDSLYKSTNVGYYTKYEVDKKLAYKVGGSSAFSGDGTTTTFNISISSGWIPSQVTITPTSVDAAKASFYVSSKSATQFTIISTGTTPPSGVNNVTIDYQLIK